MGRASTFASLLERGRTGIDRCGKPHTLRSSNDGLSADLRIVGILSRVTFRRVLQCTLLAVVTAAVLAGSAVASQGATSMPRLKSPEALDLMRAGTAIPDSTLSVARTRTLAATASWGGTFTASTGEQVHIQVSDSYPRDPAVAQRWANFLASLVHGAEISTVNVYLAPLPEVQQFCGLDALACYSPVSHQLVAPGDDPSSDVSAEAVVTHEYGHHVAASRSNSPWPAVEYGTKRWATYEQVCARTRSGQLFPGAEDVVHYMLNPGEAFAETYRVLNQRRLGVPETAWDIVAQSLYPDDTALSLLQQDVVSPWTANTSSTASVPLTKRARVKTISVTTPWDGAMRVTARTKQHERVRMQVLSTSAPASSATVVPGGTTRSAARTVCGARTIRVRLTLTAGTGSVVLTTSKP